MWEMNGSRLRHWGEEMDKVKCREAADVWGGGRICNSTYITGAGNWESNETGPDTERGKERKQSDKGNKRCFCAIY